MHEFVYFHSKYLDGLGDTVLDDKEGWWINEHNKAVRAKQAERDASGIQQELPAPPALQEHVHSEKVVRANVRIFVQTMAGAASRVKFGFDPNQPDQIRTERLSSGWEVIRADNAPADEIDDPVAYPLPGDNPKWEANHLNATGDPSTGCEENAPRPNLSQVDIPTVLPPSDDVNMPGGAENSIPSTEEIVSSMTQKSSAVQQEYNNNSILGTTGRFNFEGHEIQRPTSLFQGLSENAKYFEDTKELRSKTGSMNPENDAFWKHQPSSKRSQNYKSSAM